MKKLIYILSIIFFATTYAQKKENSDCGLRTENENWKLEFKKADSKSERIALIRQKLIADSIYIEMKPVINTAHGRLNNHEDKNGNYCGCKISFLLSPKNQNVQYSLNLNSRPNLIKVINSFNQENIEQILYILENDNQALGPSGKCGVVRLTTKDKKLAELIKNVW